MNVNVCFSFTVKGNNKAFSLQCSDRKIRTKIELTGIKQVLDVGQKMEPGVQG